jgi:hypothetical protein
MGSRSNRSNKEQAVPRGSSSPNSPGLGGAIKDAIGAVGNYMGTRGSDVQRSGSKTVRPRTRREQQIEEAGG